MPLNTCQDDLTASFKLISSGIRLALRRYFALVLVLLGPYVADAQSNFNEDARELRRSTDKLLFDQKYKELDDLIAGIRKSGTLSANGGSYLVMLYNELGTLLDGPDNTRTAINDRLQRVLAWSEARPSIAAQITLADCYCEQASNARGTGLAGSITADGMSLMDQSARSAEAALRKATAIAADQGVQDPNIASKYMQIGMLSGYSREQMEGYVNESLEIDPWFNATISTMCNFLMPRWYGNPGDRAEFAKDCAAAHQEQSGDSIYAIVALQSFDSGDATEFSSDGLPWPRVRQGFHDLIAREPDSPQLLGQLARMAHIAGDRESARVAIEQLEGRWMKRIWKTELGFQRTVRWAFDDGQPGESIRVVELGPTLQRNVCVVNEGRDFVLSYTGFHLPVYRIETGERVKKISTWPNSVFTVANQSSGRTTDFVLYGQRQYLIQRVDLERETFETIGVTDAIARDFVTSENGRGIALCDSDNDVKFWQIETNPLPFEWSKVFPEKLAGVAISPDAKRVLSGSTRTLKTWDTQSHEALHTWDAQNEQVYALAWSPDGHILASAGAGTEVILWNADDGREIGRIGTDAPDQYILSLAFSPDGKRLVAGTYSSNASPSPGQVVVCDVAALKLVKSLTGHRLGVWSVTVTPDGKKILSASEDGSVRIWEMPSE